MQTTENRNQGSDKIVVHFDNEFDGLGDIEFKPITKGLGFHNQEKKKKLSASIRPKRAAEAPPRSSTTPARPTEAKSVPTLSRPISSITSSTTSLTEVTLEEEVKVEEKVIAPTEKNLEFYTRQLGAWIIDVAFLGALSAAIVSLPYLAISFDFKMLPEVLVKEDSRLALAVVFGCFYLLYFTLMDVVGGIGKSLFKLRLISLNSEVPSFFQSFTRAFVSLLGLFAIGLPSVLNFQGRLSETDLEVY